MMRPIDTATWTPVTHIRNGHDYFSGQPLRIGNRAQLLGHGALVEDRRGIIRRVTRPQRHGSPILIADQPWEGRSVFFPQIMADEHTGRLRMWYGTHLGIAPEGRIHPYTLLYAESDDGFHWDKPLLDIVPDGEHARTNMLYRGANDNCSAFRIVIDPNETDAAKKYKMLHKGAMSAGGAEELALSSDGLHWRPYENNPVMPHRHDCNLNLLYDTSKRMWTAYGRPYAFSSGIWPGAKVPASDPIATARTAKTSGSPSKPWIVHHRRRVAIAESVDLIHWSKLRTVLGPEEGDENEFDNISILPYGDVLVGMISIFSEGSGHIPGQRMHVEPAFSIDGRSWERVPGKGHLLSPTGVAGDFDCDSVYAPAAALIDDASGEILIYYNGISWEEGKARESRTAIGLLRLPADRFVEQYADDEGGWLLTREFLLEGDNLEVNCRAKGFLKVELAEYPGQPIPGFSLEQCDPITGDHAAQTVTWRQGQRDLTPLRGKPIYVRFQMADAGIWSFTVRDSLQR